MAELPKYPKELLAKEWDKHKGVVAKMKGFTGIGDMLKSLETGYKTLEKTSDLKVLERCKSFAEIEKLAGPEGKAYRNLFDELKDFVKLATDTAKAYRDSATVGKTTRKYVEDMADKATTLREAMETWQLADYQGAVGRRMNSVEVAGASLVEKAKGLPGALLKVLKQIKDLNEEKEKISAMRYFHSEWTRTLSGDLTSFVKGTKNQALSKLVGPWTSLGDHAPHDATELREYVKNLMEEMDTLKKTLIREGVKV